MPLLITYPPDIQFHLAILTKNWIDPILSGEKTIESRFSKVRCAPYGKVKIGDKIFLKESGGLVKGSCIVDNVKTYAFRSESEIHHIYREKGQAIFAGEYDPQQPPPEKWLTAKYATLIYITDPIPYLDGAFPYKKKDQRAWVLLDEPLSLH